MNVEVRPGPPVRAGARRPGHRAITRVAVWVLMVFLGTCVAGAGERVVAVGDVHGAYDGLVAILGETGVVDGDLAWSGGTTRLVQIGDLLDRGAEVRPVMDLVMRLQREAEAAGGRSSSELSTP